MKGDFGKLEDEAVVDGKVVDKGCFFVGLTSHLPSSYPQYFLSGPVVLETSNCFCRVASILSNCIS
jgi:hypothetical protein